MADGKIIAISISEKKGKKHNNESANLIVDHGMEVMHMQEIGIVKSASLGIHKYRICVRQGQM